MPSLKLTNADIENSKLKRAISQNPSHLNLSISMASQSPYNLKEMSSFKNNLNLQEKYKRQISHGIRNLNQSQMKQDIEGNLSRGESHIRYD